MLLLFTRRDVTQPHRIFQKNRFQRLLEGSRALLFSAEFITKSVKQACSHIQAAALFKLRAVGKKCDSSENYELNTRLVYAMRCIGKGAESARMFCGIMNLPPPPTKFSKYNHILLQATRETCEHSMAEAVREAVDENDGKRDLAVAVDGSWQKRGFSSKNGLVTVTSVDTGKVIDVEVFSKHCICPNKTKHLQNCKRNFEGYSGKMEVAGALSIFQRSQSLYNVRYTKYLGDGDSKAFTSIVENKVYGDHCSVEKLECIGHVMKRMGTRLRRLKTKMRGQKLSDGKPLCGRNRLTEAEIDRLQAYYGLAIRRNLSSVKDMQQAIWAIFLHKLSTDEKPQHGFCPSDSDTWCKFKKQNCLGRLIITKIVYLWMLWRPCDLFLGI
ncbi:uncharacterized protein TNCV_4459111 [Trichonephila clavipes]|nr:uncharacterized protein TNCV_4459111 [Trichonephila clavipes]